MLTSSTRIRDRASSVTLPSIPSYRPQAKISHGSAAYAAACRCVNGTPPGVGMTSSGSRPGDSVEGLAPRLRLHHHAGPAAERRVIDGVMNIMGPAAQIVHSEGNVT